MNHPKIHYTLYILIPLVFLTACVGAAAKPRIQLAPCKVGIYRALCGSLQVYENRATHRGRTIELNIVVIKAQSEAPAPDPIFYLAGGPGVAATEDALNTMQVLGSANYKRDLVFVDQRGTGNSNKLVCPQSIDPTRQVEELRACVANLGSDPSAYTTAWAMDDVDDVRAALGYDRINLYGGSYGATAAQVYILRHESHVRAAALDGISLLDVPMFERYPISSQEALELMFSRCEADAACHSAFPDLGQEFAGALALLNRAPIPQPINDPSTGQPVLLTTEIFRTTVHKALVSTQTAALAPLFIHLIYLEDWNGLAIFLAPFMSPASETPQWNLMNLTIVCNEDWAKIRPEETQGLSAGSYLKYADVRALTVPEEICAAMPRPQAKALYGPVKRSMVPMILVNGEVDPQDPPENVAGAKQRYPNSLNLIAPGQAHSYTGISCRASIIADFMERGSVAGLNTDCLKVVQLPAFVVP